MSQYDIKTKMVISNGTCTFTKIEKLNRNILNNIVMDVSFELDDGSYADFFNVDIRKLVLCAIISSEGKIRYAVGVPGTTAGVICNTKDEAFHIYKDFHALRKKILPFRCPSPPIYA
jgi:hypothetical protein